MEKNVIYKSFGLDYLNMTKRLLAKSDLATLIMQKCGINGKIVIKPNLVTITPAQFGGTTHPEIIAGIIEYLKEHNFNNITIMEGSWVGDKTSEAFEYCGYNSLSRKYNIPLVDTQKDGSFKVNCKGLELAVCNSYKDVDFLINVPVLKGHGQTLVTCALKNMKGLIPNFEKRHFHAIGLHKPIAYLNAYIKQDFIVIDHICGDPYCEDGGSPLVKNCVMTALDPVLVDSYASNVLGYEKEEIEYILLAEKLGVGSSNLENAVIEVIEGKDTDSKVDRSNVIKVKDSLDEVESCSACYNVLAGAIDKLNKEGLEITLTDKICIGQGFKDKKGKYGAGNCTRNFENFVMGCPPKEEDIYNAIKEWLNK